MTLEEEVIKNRAPLVASAPAGPASYKPVLESDGSATSVSGDM